MNYYTAVNFTFSVVTIIMCITGSQLDLQNESPEGLFNIGGNKKC